LTSERRVTWAIVCGLTAHLAIALWNGLAGPSFGAEADAQTFHRYAIQVARHVEPPESALAVYSYAHALGLVYRITGESLLIGSLLSCAGWLAAALLLRGMMRLLHADAAAQVAGLLIFGLLPSTVLWNSVTLREPYQLLGVNLALYGALRIVVARDRRQWLLIVAAIVVGAYLHAVIAMFAVFIAAVTIFLELWDQLKPAGRVALVIGVSLLSALAAIVLFRVVFEYDLKSGPQEALENFLLKGMYPARTNYRDSWAVGGVVGLALFIPVSLAQYLFEPMPWHVNAPIDAGYVFENIIRALLIGAMLFSVVRLNGARRRHVAVIAVSYFFIETLWSMGTLNWGTSARHHLPAGGVLIAGATAYSSRWRTVRASTAPAPQRLRA
jgi:hypothetical protein